MSFMERQIEQGFWFEIETSCGTWFLPSDVAPQTAHDFCAAVVDGLHDSTDVPATVACDLLQFTECRDANDIQSVSMRAGFGARLSAPGYMDCTEWCVFETEDEANAYLDETYPEDDSEDDCE